MTTVLPNKHDNGHSRATEKETDQRAPAEEILRKKWGQQDSWMKMEAAVQDRAGWR